jgi:hypothetical protein
LSLILRHSKGIYKSIFPFAGLLFFVALRRRNMKKIIHQKLLEEKRHNNCSISVHSSAYVTQTINYSLFMLKYMYKVKHLHKMGRTENKHDVQE